MLLSSEFSLPEVKYKGAWNSTVELALTMLFGPLSLALHIALAVANPLVGRSEVTALQAAFVGLNTTFYDFHQACNTFAINVDSAHAMAVYDDIRILDSQTVNTSKIVPEHVMSDVDGKWLCDGYTYHTPVILQFMDEVIARKDDFRRVTLVEDVCFLLRTYVTDDRLLRKKLLDATPAESRMCVAKYQNSVGKAWSRVLNTFCDHSE